MNPHLSRREWIALLAILVLAALLRFGWPGLSSFAGDEARISLDALRLTRGGEFVYVAQPSSTGIPFLPASVWMFAPAFLLSPDPQIATWFVSLLSWLCVPLAWGLGRRWSASAGLIAALLLAASPYAVLYGRSIWQPNLLPILGLAWAWTALLALTASTERRQRAATAANAFFALFIWQVHFAGLPFALGTLYLIVRFRWWRRWLPLLLGAGLAALLTLPYVYYVLTQDASIAAALGQAAGGAQVDLQALGRLLQLALAWDWGYLALGSADTFSRWPPLTLLAAVLFIAGLAALIGWLRRKDTSAQPGRYLAEIVLVWLLISPLFFLRHSSPVLPHYLLIALPAAALTAGASVTLLPRRSWRWAVTAAALLLALGWTIQIAASLDDALLVRPPESMLSSALSESRSAIGALPADRPVLFFGHGDDPAISGEAAVFRVLLWGRPNSRVINGETLLILPPYPAALMATVPPFQAWEELTAAGLSEPSLQIPRRAPSEPFIAALYDGEADPQGFTPLDRPVRLADGAALEGWRTRPISGRLRISTLWRVEDTPPGATLQQFHHLYPLGPEADAACARGEAPDQPDWAAIALAPPLFSADVPVSAGSWRIGDRLIVMADVFGLPAGAYALRAGHYTLPGVARIPRTDGSDGAADLGAFCVHE